MTLGASFNISVQSLIANQTAMSVVSNNIANMNTEGYSKQRVNFAEAGYTNTAGTYGNNLSIGTGVVISNIQRYRDSYLDEDYRTQNSDSNFYNQLSSMASTIEGSLNEIQDGGIEDAFSAFYSSLSQLTSNPSNSTYRMDFVQKAQSLCDKFNQTSDTLTEARKLAVGDINDASTVFDSKVATSVDTVNEKLKNLQDLNEQIMTTTSLDGTISSTLLDKRDSLLDELSQYIPIQTSTNPNNNFVSVSMNGVSLIDSSGVKQLSVAVGDANNPTTVQLKDEKGTVVNTNVNDQIDSGTIGAYLQMGGDSTTELTYKSMLDKLDTLASVFANTMNAIQTYDDTAGSGVQAMAIGTDPVTGEQILSDYGGLPNLFTDDTGTTATTVTAGNIQVSDAIKNDYWQIATARVDTVTDADADGTPDYDPRSIGNAENAKLFSSAKSTPIVGLGNQTMGNYLTSTVSNMGIKIESLNNKAETQDAVLTNANTKRQSAIGVNLDEELSDLIKFQRAYEASARVFNVTNEILQTLVSLGT